MKKLKRDFPFKLKIGFKKVFDAYKENTPETEGEKNLA